MSQAANQSVSGARHLELLITDFVLTLYYHQLSNLPAALALVAQELYCDECMAGPPVARG